MSSEPPNLLRLAQALEAVPDLRYVLVGGLAVTMHGGTRVTVDADLAIAFEVENRRRLVAALAPLNPRPLRIASGAAWEWDEKCIRGPWSIFQTDAGRVDLIIRLPDGISFEDLFGRAVYFDLMGTPVRVASIEDLVLMKTQAGRERDRDDINQLLAIQRLRAEQG